jgi:hypothetical protein
MVKSNTKEFIEKAIKIHGYKYDYSKVKYIGTRKNINIICNIHGEFTQLPVSHLKGAGCKKCNIIKKFNKEQFIEKSNKIHMNKYNYSKIDYTGSSNKIIIVCILHGDFSQKVNDHLNNKGCPKCAKNYNYNTEEFIIKANFIHKNKYNYLKVNYVNTNTKIKIICKIHGEFEQIPNIHLNGSGCDNCSIENKFSNTKEFIEKTITIHNNTYDYSKVNYITAETKITIICKTHGEFQQTPHSHLNGYGCSKCSKTYHYNTSEFIIKSIELYNEKYDYSKVKYINNRSNIILICKIHGEFEQTASSHLRGKECHKCIQNSYSKISINWLEFLSKYYNTNIQHALNSNEFKIPNTKYKADGYCKETNTIYEFHGDFWHGNHKLFNKDTLNKITKTTFGELYKKTLEREEIIKNKGFNLITIWEYDWKKINKSIKILQQKFKKI